jgi:hypothetical protein
MALRTQAGIGCLRPFTVYPATAGLPAIAFSRSNLRSEIYPTRERLRVDSLLI